MDGDALTAESRERLRAETIEAALTAAGRDRYLTKVQAKALAAEIERLSEALTDAHRHNDHLRSEVMAQRAAAERGRIVKAERVGPHGLTEELVECGLCHSREWLTKIIALA